MKRIPIKEARECAEKYDATIVCIVAWDGKTGVQHVTTYGKSKQECGWAAELGNKIKRQVLKWPEEECHTRPKRTDRPGNPNSEYTCESCGEPRNGYENHTCAEMVPCGAYGCKRPRRSNEIFCDLCRAEFHEDPDAFK